MAFPDLNGDGKINFDDLNTEIFGLKFWYWLLIGAAVAVSMMPKYKRKKLLGF